MNKHVNDTGAQQARNALSTLREASAGVGAPDAMEARLRQAFRAHHKTPAVRRSRHFAWIGGAVAASLVIAAGVRLLNPKSVNSPERPTSEMSDRIASKPERLPEKVASPVVAADARPESARQRIKRLPPQAPGRIPMRVAKAPEHPQRQVTTDFFAIPYAPAMTQFDRGQFVRVKVPASSMRSFGLPVSEERAFERVQADVLMGEDGIARAIRFIR